MKNEKPILFSGEMVRAILDGRKTQTRRIGKIQGNYVGLGVEIVRHATKGHEAIATHDAYPGRGTARHVIYHSLFGIPSDRLWVRETFAAPWGLDYKFPSGESGILYRADNPQKFPDDGTWKPSIFMPRKASRITLEIVRVRVERLQDISQLDAMAEGCGGDYISESSPYRDEWLNSPFHTSSLPEGSHDFKSRYSRLWESINGVGSWAKNPWVWVIEFKNISTTKGADDAK